MAQGQFHFVSQLLTNETLVNGTPIVFSTNFLDTRDFSRLNMFAEYIYQATAATTGITINQYYGMALDETAQTILWAANTDNVPNLPVTISQGSPQTNVWEWNIPLTQLPRYIGFEVANLDTTNDCVLNLYADLG